MLEIKITAVFEEYNVGGVVLGFTITHLLFSVLIALVVYEKKKRESITTK